ncbi:uncharacterized protein LOC122533571 isoform X1 [Frieseomelitta varia]|uniref:uncharacterized protein LOC122533571 isoform X1 n=1 Tax=Frieseomelitta varia TaxID=561572 RepID=UPI001CB68369|nr:uncharacterized protein LOC122533571 isoform X1 [Frieseomelitta varia]
MRLLQHDSYLPDAVSLPPPQILNSVPATHRQAGSRTMFRISSNAVPRRNISRVRRSDYSSEVHPVNALYAFDCCSESLDYDIGFRAIIIITKGQNLNSACCRWHLLLQESCFSTAASDFISSRQQIIGLKKEYFFL